MVVSMELVGVRVQMPTNAPVMLLRETTGERRLVPIFIGGPEAHAIDLALSGAEPPRPMTHDLFVTTIEALGGRLDRVVVTEVRDGTFYAELVLAVGEDETVLSARPSDAVALAARTGAPLFAEEALVDEAGVEEQESTEPSDGEEEALVDELRAFLESATPEDFSGDQ